MNAACLVAEYSTAEKAQLGLEVLANLDFATDAISIVSLNHEGTLGHLVLPEPDPDDEDAHELSKSMEVGALLGGAVLAPAFLGTIIGPLIVAGPLVALVAGASIGGVLDGTSRWGIQRNAAEHYEQRIKDGAVLIIVTSTPPRLDEAESSLKTTGPDGLQRFAHKA
ncbi:MAG: DUF1269 domain-containing protein [Aureliella sp.]